MTRRDLSILDKSVKGNISLKVPINHKFGSDIDMSELMKGLCMTNKKQFKPENKCAQAEMSHLLF